MPNLFSTPGPQGEMAIRVEVTNMGSTSTLPVVSGRMTGFELERDPDRWSVGAADADCTTPLNYCSYASCDSTRRAGARYTCRFRTPLLPGESTGISIGLTASTDGGTLRSGTRTAGTTWHTSRPR